jgi:hypothetical protein
MKFGKIRRFFEIRFFLNLILDSPASLGTLVVGKKPNASEKRCGPSDCPDDFVMRVDVNIGE